jgi:hypothetical protein
MAVAAALAAAPARAGDEAKGSAPPASDPDREPSKAPQWERAEPVVKPPPQVVGRVAEVGKGTISIARDDGKVERLRVTKETRILKEGKSVPLSSLEPGTAVRAGLTGGKDDLTATRIDVGAGNAASLVPVPEHPEHSAQQPVKEKARSEKE